MALSKSWDDDDEFFELDNDMELVNYLNSIPDSVLLDMIRAKGKVITQSMPILPPAKPAKRDDGQLSLFD